MVNSICVRLELQVYTQKFAECQLKVARNENQRRKERKSQEQNARRRECKVLLKFGPEKAYSRPTQLVQNSFRRCMVNLRRSAVYITEAINSL